MASVKSFVESNPGCPMIDAARWVGPHGSLGFGYDTVHRARKAGLIWAIKGACGRWRLYPVACKAHSDCKQHLALGVACSRAA